MSTSFGLFALMMVLNGYLMYRIGYLCGATFETKQAKDCSPIVTEDQSDA